MSIFYVIEILLLIATTWFVVTQVIVPAVRGKKLFPLFTKEQELKSVMISQEQQFAEQRLSEQIEANEQMLQSKSSKNDTTKI